MAAQPSQPPSLRILSWNLDGLRGRKLELEEILHRLEIDVAALQETKLSETSRITLPGYDIYRHDRDANGGGVALAVKSCIDHYPLQRLQTQNTEAVAIAVRSLRHRDVAVVSCYHPPRLPILDADLDTILSFPQTIAMGDFNAKSPAWHSRATTAGGRALLNYTNTHNDLTILGPTEPTYHALNHPPDVLDIALLKSVPLIAQISAEHEGSTAHNPVLLDVGRRQRNMGTFTRRFTDWGRFRAEMQRNTAIPVIETTEDLEAAILTLETDIKHALTQTTTETVVPRLTNPRLTLPDDVKQLIRDRRRLKRLATRTRLPQHRHDLNVLNRRVKAALSELAQESWARHLESLDPQDNSLWKTQRALRLPARSKIPPIHGTRGVVYTNQEKAEAFADSLELQCRLPLLPDEDEEFETTRLTWKPHIVETVARARATRARLYPLLKGNNTLSLRNKRTLIKVVLQAQLTYASTAWGHAAKSHIKTLQAVENIALRTATASPWYVRNADILRDLQYTNATQTIRTNAQKRFDQATTHGNPLLRQAVEYQHNDRDKHKRPRHVLIDPG
ncbi:hypothetical protein NQ315_012458 [Exocentrus adspersus]|uniref:Endonuclease/exonuclease/phosphatase domain-containing protein n=1 Tax=Exocentrus adspersus TaxID=1586481 RepID=A0AAV8VMN8_9CUCU|nr:hypothetical protein NQ315_012458 [Exocentrus adspersus]